MAWHFVWEDNELQQKMKKRRVKVIQNFQVIPLLQILYDSPTVGHAEVDKIFRVVQ